MQVHDIPNMKECLGDENVEKEIETYQSLPITSEALFGKMI